MTFSITFIMQSVKSHSYFKPESQFFNVKDKKTKEQRGTMDFEIGVHLIRMFSYVSHMSIFICTFGVNHIGFCMYFCLQLLSITLFVQHLMPPCEVSEGIYCISLCLYQFFCPSVCLFWFDPSPDFINLIIISFLLPSKDLS